MVSRIAGSVVAMTTAVHTQSMPLRHSLWEGVTAGARSRSSSTASGSTSGRWSCSASSRERRSRRGTTACSVLALLGVGVGRTAARSAGDSPPPRGCHASGLALAAALAVWFLLNVALLSSGVARPRCSGAARRVVAAERAARARSHPAAAADPGRGLDRPRVRALRRQLRVAASRASRVRPVQPDRRARPDHRSACRGPRARSCS